MPSRIKKSIWAILILLLVVAIGALFSSAMLKEEVQPASEVNKEHYWFVLHRQSNIEELFFGIPGDRANSKLIKNFVVKTGIPNKRPTPLPSLLGREYWLITKKESSAENPETAPYFLTLDIPAPSDPPYGPSPYTECNGEQCDWILPGAFGLHGSGGNPSKLSQEDPGSSGCIRHTDQEITYLYNLLDPENEEIRYYIEDN
jgi:lipoprotein-anchoring transpeptidase ErfK/SrfK